MIKSLQKKFVVTSMTATGILLLVLCLIFNIVNACSSYNQNKRVLNMLSEKEFSVLWQIPQEFGSTSSGFLQPPMDENMRRSSIYFVAYADRNNKVIFIDTNQTAGVTREEAFEIAQNTVTNGKLSGKTGAYRYKAVKTQNDIGTAYVFLDTSQEHGRIIRTMFISAVAAIFCFGLMLLLTVALSKKAIAPIAENIEKQKNFVTDAGHEIKTPLAIILANTEALELYNGETKWTKNIKEQTNRLSYLMQDLLSLSRLDNTPGEKITEPVSFSEITSKTVDMFRESAEMKSITINENIQPDIKITADREHMERLVSVLTDNAVKYSSENSEINVCLFKKDKKTVLTVSNVCDSLPECKSEKLFDRFYRGDSSRNQRGGYGIGLSAAKAIVELYHGKIYAEYKSGNIITFTVII